MTGTNKLAFVDPNTNRAIIKVDNVSTVDFNNKRSTVRIDTQDLYPVGSVWVADMHHVPFGCSVWPAWWSQALKWPDGGEIDTFEGVNLFTQNQMALHTTDGCNLVSPVQSSDQIQGSNCSVNVNTAGCVVKDPDQKSYGQPFADAGGGMFVTEMASSGVSIWFFTREKVPSSLSSNSSTIDTSAFGKPVANFPSGSCAIDKFFQPQALIFDITLCGDFARPLYNTSGCPVTRDNSCYLDRVLGPGSGKYDDAYFDIAFVRVYGSSSGNSTNSTNGGNSTNSMNGGNSTNTTGGGTGTSSAVAVGTPYTAFLFAAIVAALLGLFI
ncbi:hypothetical protein V5O48_005678 [Marasmius crinis-equi]|uniref:GH16 domain-containing protein n=1 Tax=Marasmius crinis-equi TaxID=585013 RepID=A0ABR3FLR1_9AGAR